MAEGLNGMNKRVRETVAEECYLTPPWAVSWLLERWTPSGTVVCDPCACGYGGWSIGRTVSSTTGRLTELYDISPRNWDVDQADFRTLRLPEVFRPRDRTIITNPPYNLLPEFVPWALSQADEVVVLTRFGFLCAEQGRRARHLAAYYQPAKRLAFELLPEEGRRRVEHNRALAMGEIRGKPLDVHEDPRCLTGYRMSSTGVDHGWAVYQRGYEGPARLVIEPALVKDVQDSEVTPW